ncbi:MAG TPA: prephenate dehydrogenase [Myxococcota bacterium]
MSAVFERVAVVGLGLLGGSVALAAKRRGVAVRVVGATRREDARERALRQGAVDEIASLDEVARGADLVILATPVYAMADALRGLAPALGEGAIVTDVGSVKTPLVESLPGLLPPGAVYVGSHPMAGSHERGMEHAREDLFDGASCIVTRAGDARAADRVCAFWRGVGAVVVQRDARVHDEEVAWVSHVPHVLAFAFARALAAAPAGARDVAGAGFRDFTRIARSDAELWGDILTANGKALAAPLHAVADALTELTRAIEAGEVETLEGLLESGRQALARMSAIRSEERKVREDSKLPSSSQRGDDETGERNTDHE